MNKSTMMTLEFLKKNGIKLDDMQQIIMGQLIELNNLIISKSSKRRYKKKKSTILKGIYIFGKVGRGKTYLMDIFFNSLETNRKKRLHFQRFMKDIHCAIYKLSGTPAPLNAIAAELAEAIDILCLDELYIDDIADAMLLEGLFHALYQHGMVFVITSNLPPDDLDNNGVDKNHLMKAITLLNQHNHIMNLGGEIDYRQVKKPIDHVFFFGNQIHTYPKISNYYHKLNKEESSHSGAIEINQRQMICKGQKSGIIWFDFSELCEKPRSQYDYIYLAQHYHTLFISDIPQLDDHNPKDRLRTNFNNNRARRFISLIDEIYDRSVNLVASFETSLNEIYLADELKFQFNRTYSRLSEIQTKAYRQQPHRR